MRDPRRDTRRITRINTVSDEHLVQAMIRDVVKNLHLVMEQDSRTKDYTRSDKFIIGTLLYERIKIHLKTVREMEKPPSSLILDYLPDVLVDFEARIKRNSRVYSLLNQRITASRGRLINFFDVDIGELEQFIEYMDEIMITDIQVPDHFYSIDLFNIQFGVMMSENKVENLKRIYYDTLYPFLKQIKEKLNIPMEDPILIVEEALNDRTPKLLIGEAITFSLASISTNDVLEWLDNGEIELPNIKKRMNVVISGEDLSSSAISYTVHGIYIEI